MANLPDSARAALPFDDDAEQSALGAMLESKEAIANVIEVVNPDDFHKPAHREIYGAILALHGRGESVDAVLVADELQRRGSLEWVGGKLYLAGLLEAYPTAASAGRYALIVAELARQRRFVALCAEGQRDPSRMHALIGELGRCAQPSSSVLFEPIDLPTALAVDPEPMKWLHEPLIPARRRVWAFGAAESGKSMYAAWLACRLSREGLGVVYVSQENPLEEEVRRLRRLTPDPEHFRLLHDAGLDLARRDHVSSLITMSEGATLVVIDTLSACWSGDENDNAAVAMLDREALAPLVNQSGATALILDHTGHPQAFVRRSGVSAGRGASTKGQKADAVLELGERAVHEFSVRVAKMRGGNRAEVRLRVVDTEDGALDLIEGPTSADPKVTSMADAMVEAITASGPLTTNALREAVRSLGGKDAQSAAMKSLEAETPSRVVAARETVDTTTGGRQHAKVWRPAPDSEARQSGGSPEVVRDGLGSVGRGSPERVLFKEHPDYPDHLPPDALDQGEPNPESSGPPPDEDEAIALQHRELGAEIVEERLHG